MAVMPIRSPTSDPSSSWKGVSVSPLLIGLLDIVVHSVSRLTPFGQECPSGIMCVLCAAPLTTGTWLCR
eukprot:m.481747 g.481747  ORF g.481747 m.481747 type:complete len:69 (-) comp57747_c0_seq1:199-405(-)